MIRKFFCCSFRATFILNASRRSSNGRYTNIRSASPHTHRCQRQLQLFTHFHVGSVCALQTADRIPDFVHWLCAIKWALCELKWPRRAFYTFCKRMKFVDFAWRTRSGPGAASDKYQISDKMENGAWNGYLGIWNCFGLGANWNEHCAHNGRPMTENKYQRILRVWIQIGHNNLRIKLSKANSIGTNKNEKKAPSSLDDIDNVFVNCKCNQYLYIFQNRHTRLYLIFIQLQYLCNAKIMKQRRKNPTTERWTFSFANHFMCTDRARARRNHFSSIPECVQ